MSVPYLIACLSVRHPFFNRLRRLPFIYQCSSLALISGSLGFLSVKNKRFKKIKGAYLLRLLPLLLGYHWLQGVAGPISMSLRGLLSASVKRFNSICISDFNLISKENLPEIAVTSLFPILTSMLTSQQKIEMVSYMQDYSGSEQNSSALPVFTANFDIFVRYTLNLNLDEFSSNSNLVEGTYSPIETETLPKQFEFDN